MPEYSTPKITPAETTKIPGMNDSSSGYVLTSELLDIIRATYGQANGVATLDNSGKLPSAQLPDLADDVIVVASYAVLPATGTAGKLYITADTNLMYRWDPDLTTPDYVEMSVDVSNLATKAELAEETEAREAAVSTLQTKTASLQKQIDNITEAEDLLQTVDYANGENAVPANVSKYAEVGVLKGVSRVENGQLVPTLHAGSINNGITPSYDASTQTMGLSGTSTGSFDAILIDATAILTTGHTYLVALEKGATGFTFVDNYQALSNTASYVFTAGNAYFNIRARGNAGVTLNYEGRIGLTDLNIYFNTNDLSFLGATDSAKLATIQQNYHELLVPSDYGTSVVFPTYTAVKSVGVNLFNPYAEQITTFGTGTISNDGDTISITGTYYCEFKLSLPAGKYYARWDNGAGTSHSYRIHYKDGTFSQTYGSGVTATAEQEVVGLYIYCSGGTVQTSVYNNFQFALDESDGKTTYHRYHEPDTLTLPEPVTLKSAGSVRDTLELCAGIEQEINGQKVTIYKKRETQRIDSVDMGSLNWILDSGVFYARLDVMKEGYECLQPIYSNLGVQTWAYMTGTAGDKTFASAPSGSAYPYVMIKDSSFADAPSLKTYLTGKTMYYPLATESVTLSDPILDNWVQVEPNGTIETVQSQTPKVDGAMSVTYTRKVSA